MSAMLIGGIIGGVVFLIAIMWFFSTYNRLVRLKENANKSWADIDVLLKQRYDMMPNLINTVKGYASHEKDLFMEFAKARQSASDALSQGDVSGVAAAEGANSSSVGGALIPLLTLGIPGSASTAVLIGALMIHDLTPGPQLFISSPDIIYGLLASLLLANIILLALGFFGSRLWIKVTIIPK